VNKEDVNGGHWIRASDGVELYVKVWQPEACEKPVAVVLAFHGCDPNPKHALREYFRLLTSFPLFLTSSQPR